MDALDVNYLRFLGTGTSYGVPMIGCHCVVCSSDDPRNQRLRCSSLLATKGQVVIFDVTPDFRAQALACGLERLDAVIITHVHADHVFGLDDLRPLSLGRDEPLPVYADARSCAELRRVFSYIFCSTKKRLGVPWLELREVQPGTAFEVGPLSILPFRQLHGKGESLGLRVGDLAYMTDLHELPAESEQLLQGVKTLALDMLRVQPHGTHLCLAKSLDIVERLGRPQTWFIHMGHEVDAQGFDSQLPAYARLATDGQVLEL